MIKNEYIIIAIIIIKYHYYKISTFVCRNKAHFKILFYPKSFSSTKTEKRKVSSSHLLTNVQ